MSSRYEIHLWKADEPYTMFGGECSGVNEVWHALVWDNLKREEVKECSGQDRRQVLLDAEAKRSDLEQADNSDITHEQAIRFTRVFMDVVNSVNQSNCQLAASFASADALETIRNLCKRGQS